MAKPDEPEPAPAPSAPASAPRARGALPGLPKHPGGLPSVPAPSARERNDQTIVASSPPPPARQTQQSKPLARPAPAQPPPPAPAPAPVAAAAVPAPVTAPEPSGGGRRAHSDTLTNALNEIAAEMGSDPVGPPAAANPAGPDTEPEVQVQIAPAHGVSTPEDLAAVRSVFYDVAVAHVSHVRDVMLEVRFGEADPKWIELTKPALRSLRAMAERMDLSELCAALDEFCAAVDASVTNRARVTDDDKAELLRRYARLVEMIPQAFELDAERDRREPIIVEALLYQIDGVERPTIDKLFAVGLNRLEALISANAGDLAAMSGLRMELATAIVEHFQLYRMSVPATVSAPDPSAERRQLGDLLIMLSIQNDDFARASSEWSDEAQARKRLLRKQREQTFQQIKVMLARLGEREQLQRLEKMTFNERISTIDRYLSSHPASQPGSQPARPL